MRYVGPDRLSWLDEYRLVLERGYFITHRGRVYWKGWATIRSRSKYRLGNVPYWPWRDRATMSGSPARGEG